VPLPGGAVRGAPGGVVVSKLEAREWGEPGAPRVVFLHEGRVAFFGPMDEMRHKADPFIHEFLAFDEPLRARE